MESEEKFKETEIGSVDRLVDKVKLLWRLL